MIRVVEASNLKVYNREIRNDPHPDRPDDTFEAERIIVCCYTAWPNMYSDVIDKLPELLEGKNIYNIKIIKVNKNSPYARQIGIPPNRISLRDNISGTFDIFRPLDLKIQKVGLETILVDFCRSDTCCSVDMCGEYCIKQKFRNKGYAPLRCHM